MVPKRRVKKSAGKKRIKFSVESVRRLLSVPKGEFYANLVSLDKRLNMPTKEKETLIRQRMQKIGKPELIKEWKNLVIKKRIFEKVLSGEPRAQFGLDIPKTKKAIERQIDEAARQIAEILHDI